MPEDPIPPKSNDVVAGDTYYPLRWYFRPESIPATPAPVVVQLKEDLDEYAENQLHSVLSEIDIRHWKAVRQILIAAKIYAELRLRNDEVIKHPQLSAACQGWVNYADYILANLEAYRAGNVPMSRSGDKRLSETLR